ncbi:hypothetical protein ACN28S_23165 [Cystobacter fuscus]
MNFGWGIINLLPVLPLDGGQILRGVLGPTRQRLTLWVGVIVAGPATALFLFVGAFFAAFMFGRMAFDCWQALSVARDVKPLPPVQAVEPEPEALARGWQALRSGQETEAARLAHRRSRRPGRARRPTRRGSARLGGARRGQPPRRPVPPGEGAAAPGRAALQLGHGLRGRGPAGSRPRARARRAGARALRGRRGAGGASAREGAAAGRGRAHRARLRLEVPGPARRAARGHRGGPGRLRRGGGALRGHLREHRPRGGSLPAALNHARDAQLERAAEWLKRALDAGYDDLEAIGLEPAFAPVRSAPEIAARLGQRRP